MNEIRSRYDSNDILTVILIILAKPIDGQILFLLGNQSNDFFISSYPHQISLPVSMW